jgi:ComF family protein
MVGLFDDPLRLAIHALKYERRERVAEPLSELLVHAWRSERDLHGTVAVLPLPIHRKREGERGFNQSALLARGFARRSGLPLLEGVLTRPHYRRPQVGLGAAQRRANVEGVFGVESPEEVRDKTLLLIDDVVTTGATCDAAARTLLDSGAAEVLVLALAREPYRPKTPDSQRGAAV